MGFFNRNKVAITTNPNPNLAVTASPSILFNIRIQLQLLKLGALDKRQSAVVKANLDLLGIKY